MADLLNSCKKFLGPMLETMTKLRELQIIEEEVFIPNIVVIGDRSSGKTSLIESLTGISLPRGVGMTTKLTLFMKLEHHVYEKSRIELSYEGNSIVIENESCVAEEINKATMKLVGDRKDVSSVTLTLVVKKKGYMDLKVVDLPGLIPVPTNDEQNHIYEKIRGLTMEHISPDKNSIIINVVAATTNFDESVSTKMARDVDGSGQRTVSVFTKCDQSAGNVWVKVLAENVNMDRGPVCLINRIKEESLKQARSKEAKLFDSGFLSKIPRSLVGVSALSDRVAHILCEMVLSQVPKILPKIEEDLNVSILEQNNLPAQLTSMEEELASFRYVVGCVKESMHKLLVRGETEMLSNEKMSWNSKLVIMLTDFSTQLHNSSHVSRRFLDEELQALDKPNATELTAFLGMIERKVDSVIRLPESFIDKVWEDIKNICYRVVTHHCQNYPHMHAPMKNASKKAILTAKESFLERVRSMMEREKLRDQSIDMDYLDAVAKSIRQDFEIFQTRVNDKGQTFYTRNFGTVDIRHLWDVQENTRDNAFKHHFKMKTHWDIVLVRIVDWIAIELRFAIQTMVSTDIQTEMVERFILRGGGNLKEQKIHKERRESLQGRISKLLESKRSMERLMEGM